MKLKKTTSIFLIMGIVFLNGWHLVFLQGFAWTKMYSAYSQNMPSFDAVELVLSGKAPCCLCKSIKKELDLVNFLWTDSLTDPIKLIYDSSYVYTPLAIAQNSQFYLHSFKAHSDYIYSEDPPPPRMSI